MCLCFWLEAIGFASWSEELLNVRIFFLFSFLSRGLVSGIF